MATRGYFETTRTLTYSYLSVLPLLFLYELLLFISEPTVDTEVRLSADLWIRAVFSWTGTNTLLITIFLTLVFGIVIYYKERRKLPAIRLHYFTFMVLESLVWAIVIAIAVSLFVGRLFAMAGGGTGELTFIQWMALAIGAGVYEELVFRVILVSILLFMFRQLFLSDWLPPVLAVIIGALIFSWVHYVGTFGDEFTMPSFMFRFLFGLALTALLIYRGFGIAAWTHSLYDVLVISTWQL